MVLRKFTKYRKVNIKVNLIEEANYGDDCVLNIVKFCEFDDSNDENAFKGKSNLDEGKSIQDLDQENNNGK